RVVQRLGAGGDQPADVLHVGGEAPVDVAVEEAGGDLVPTQQPQQRVVDDGVRGQVVRLREQCRHGRVLAVGEVEPQSAAQVPAQPAQGLGTFGAVPGDLVDVIADGLEGVAHLRRTDAGAGVPAPHGVRG